MSSRLRSVSPTSSRPSSSRQRVYSSVWNGTVVCSQGGAIPSVLLALGVRWPRHGPAAEDLFPPAAKGSVWVLGGRPGALSADYYRNFDPDPDGS